MLRPGSKESHEGETEMLVSGNASMSSTNIYRAGKPSNAGNIYMDPEDLYEEEKKGHPPTPVYVKRSSPSEHSTGPMSEDISRGGRYPAPARWGREYCFPSARNPSVHDDGDDENRAQRSFFAPSGGVHFSYVIVMALFFSTIVQLSRGGLLAYEQKKTSPIGSEIHPNYSHGFNNVRGNTMTSNNNMMAPSGDNMMPQNSGDMMATNNNLMDSNMMNSNTNNIAQDNMGAISGGNNMMTQQQQPPLQQLENPSLQQLENPYSMGAGTNNNMMQANQASGQFQQQPNAYSSVNANVPSDISNLPSGNVNGAYNGVMNNGVMNNGMMSGSLTNPSPGGLVNPVDPNSGTFDSTMTNGMVGGIAATNPVGLIDSSNPNINTLPMGAVGQTTTMQQQTGDGMTGATNAYVTTAAAAGATTQMGGVVAPAVTTTTAGSIADGSSALATGVTVQEITATPISTLSDASLSTGEVATSVSSSVSDLTAVNSSIDETPALTLADGEVAVTDIKTAPVDSGIAAAIDPDDSLPELNNFKDSWDPWEATDMPVFFHIPKSGGSTIKDIMGTCHRFVLASEAGVTDGHDQDTEIAIVYPKVGVPGASLSPFVNIDATTVAGIQRAKDMGFADSGLGDTVVTPFLYEANELFTESAKGRLFTVFRHPIDRAISLFYYLQVADWEPTFDPALKDWTIEEYAKSGKIENNWLTRQLSNQLSGDLEDVHVQKAMEVIRRKFLVGLMTEMEKTMTRLERYFRWTYHVNPKNQEICRDDLLNGGSNSNSKNKKEKPKEGDPAYDLLLAQNQYDMQVWGYIESLFEEQEQYVQDIPEDFRNVDATCCKCGPPTFPPEGFECPAAITEE